ncbi:hypothetical protein [Ensifer sp. 4252]|uniref:hypothetical protein n=1 Tax=Ensifer sp. 4252 TaxID=3373915 RepID=UPI003D25CF77
MASWFQVFRLKQTTRCARDFSAPLHRAMKVKSTKEPETKQWTTAEESPPRDCEVFDEHQGRRMYGSLHVATFLMLGDTFLGAMTEGGTMDLEKIGRAHMMLRLPRQRIQLAQFTYPALCGLLESYGVAVMKRDELRDSGNTEATLLAEYEYQCWAIEEEVLALIALTSPRLVR